MPQIDDFIGTDGKVDVPAVEKIAIPLNRQARVTEYDLDAIRQALSGNELARRCLGRFLQAANQHLAAAEESLRAQPGQRTALDRAYAEIEYGGQVFIFSRRN